MDGFSWEKNTGQPHLLWEKPMHPVDFTFNHLWDAPMILLQRLGENRPRQVCFSFFFSHGLTK